MNRLLVFVLLLVMLSASAIAQDESEFDAELASQLGADAYGMRPYVMAFLKAGPNRSQSPEQRDSLQQAHLQYVRTLAERGDLVLAGPFMDDGELRGIFIFATDNLEQARAWTNADPAVQAGSLVMELKPWYGSAAVQKVNDIHGRIAQSNP